MTDYRNMGVFSGNESEDTTLNSVVMFLNFFLTFRNVVFYRYISIVALTMFSIISYLIVYFAAGNVSMAQITGEFIILLCGVMFISGNVYVNDLRLRQLFFRKQKELVDEEDDDDLKSS